MIELTSFKSQGLAGDEHDVCPFIPPFHPELSISTLLPPTRSRGKVKTRRLVRLAAHVPRAHDAMPIRDGKIQQASRIDPFLPLLGHLGDEPVDPLDGPQQRPPEHRMSEPARPRIRARIHPLGALQQVQEQRERPLAVRAALHAEEPALAQRRGQRALDRPPRADAAVVHEHQRAVAEGVAVAVRQRALGRRAHVREYQRRRRLAGQPLQVDAVPRRDRRGEDARLRAQRRRGVVPDAEAVAVVRTAGILCALAGEPVNGWRG